MNQVRNHGNISRVVIGCDFNWVCFLISESSTIVITGPKTPKQLKKFFKTNALTPAETKQEGSRWVSCFRTVLWLLFCNVMNKPGCNGINSKEGTAAVQEAIDFLSNQKPLGPVEYEPIMQNIANEHAKYLGS